LPTKQEIVTKLRCEILHPISFQQKVLNFSHLIHSVPTFGYFSQKRLYKHHY